MLGDVWDKGTLCIPLHLNWGNMDVFCRAMDKLVVIEQHKLMY